MTTKGYSTAAHDYVNGRGYASAASEPELAAFDAGVAWARAHEHLPDVAGILIDRTTYAAENITVVSRDGRTESIKSWVADALLRVSSARFRSDVRGEVQVAIDRLRTLVERMG